MVLDQFTIYVLTGLLILISGVVVLVAGAAGRFDGWARCWGLGNIAVGLGSLDYIFRGLLPQPVLTAMGNMLSVAGCALVVQGFRLLAGRTAHWPRVATIVGILWILPAISQAPAQYALRVAYNDLIIAGADGWVAAEAVRLALRERLRTAWILAGLFGASVPIAIVRTIFAVITLTGTDYLRGNPIGPWLAAGLATCWVLRGTMPILVAAERSQQALTALATHDALTGALNRTGLDRLRTTLAGTAALVLVDLDHFKALNDRLGHAEGDQALRLMAEAARAEAGPGSWLVRLGGDEFLIVLPGRPMDAAAVVADRVRAAFAAAIEANCPGEDQRPGGCPPVTASIGVACGEVGGDRFGRLLAQADEALYRSKRAGRDRVSLVRAA
ncbi:MAG: diguanylate cyclase [Sphingomonas fennica]